ncbi:MAG: radical SAM protein [Desulfovibrio sp.]|nr:MAG: radical SAM protein [Desulfovibrio sp.]
MKTPDTTRHPCFNREAAGSCGRVHLPVAPRCNIMCNYCNRQYDCVNESRPGVTSAVLKPGQAVDYLGQVLEKEPRITVAGIAGPGDPMANAAQTLETMRLARERFPHMLFCLSSNGMNVPPHLDNLAKLGVTHMTITMNAVDPAIGERVYSWVRDGNVVFRGKEAAELLMERQIESIRGLKERGIIVKVNTIIIPGYNDGHVEAVATKAAELGADIMNLIPLHPTAGTKFALLEEPSKERVLELRTIAESHVKQMTHCRRCRADAVGLLAKDRSGEFCSLLTACSKTKEKPAERPYVAVATREGMLINLHLGEANSFQIWGRDSTGGFTIVEERPAPRQGGGPKRWETLAGTLKDCRMVLAAAMGDTPRLLLREHGLEAHPVSGFIQDALETAYNTGDMSCLSPRRGGIAGGCSGGGSGCA